MQQWEYCLVVVAWKGNSGMVISVNDEPFLATSTIAKYSERLGNEGWELVAITESMISVSLTTWAFKRPKA